MSVLQKTLLPLDIIKENLNGKEMGKQNKKGIQKTIYITPEMESFVIARAKLEGRKPKIATELFALAEAQMKILQGKGSSKKEEIKAIEEKYKKEIEALKNNMEQEIKKCREEALEYRNLKNILSKQGFALIRVGVKNEN